MFYEDGGKKAEFHVKHIIPELNTHHIGHLLYQRDSLIVGEYLLYYESGNIWQKARFNEEGLIEGKVQNYYADGSLKSVQLYENGLLWDVLKYKDSTGNELSVGDFKDGSGELIEYYPDGSIFFTKHYKNGKPDGLWKEFFPNGSVKSEIDYDKGVRTESL